MQATQSHFNWVGPVRNFHFTDGWAKAERGAAIYRQSNRSQDLSDWSAFALNRYAVTFVNVGSSAHPQWYGMVKEWVWKVGRGWWQGEEIPACPPENNCHVHEENILPVSMISYCITNHPTMWWHKPNSNDCNQMLPGGGVLWRLNWARHPRWHMHRAGSGCWLSSGRSAVNQSAYMWTWAMTFEYQSFVQLIVWFFNCLMNQLVVYVYPTSGSRRSPGGGHGNPLQYSCLENPTDRGAWQAAVHGVTKSQTWLKRLSTMWHRTYWH